MFDMLGLVPYMYQGTCYNRLRSAGSSCAGMWSFTFLFDPQISWTKSSLKSPPEWTLRACPFFFQSIVGDLALQVHAYNMTSAIQWLIQRSCLFCINSAPGLMGRKPRVHDWFFDHFAHQLWNNPDLRLCACSVTCGFARLFPSKISDRITLREGFRSTPLCTALYG